MNTLTKSIWIIIIFLSFSQGNYLSAQNFANKEYFLVDSLELSKVSTPDKFLIDSCLTIFHKAKHDTDKIKAITIIVEASWDDNVWPKYNLWVHDYTKKKLAKNPTNPTKNFLLSTLAGTINNIGFNYKNQGEIEKALKFYHESLKIKEQLGDKKGIAVGLNNIAIILEDQGEMEKAIEYYHTCLNLQKEIDDKEGVARSYSNIGLVYYNENKMTKAIEYCFKSKKIQEDIGDKKGLATSLNNLAAIYSKQGNIKRSLEFHKKSFELEKEIGNKQGVAWAANNVGRAYNKLKNYTEALKHIELSMKMGQELGVPVLVQNAALTFSQIYSNQKKGMEALIYFKIYVTTRDSLNNERTQKAAIKEQAKYEYEKQKAIDDAEHDNLIALKEKEKEKQTVISIATAIGLALVIVFLFFVFNRLKIARKQKLVIEIQNKEIVDSITYAKRIQEAILPSEENINNHLTNNFIYYQPKDIVAGDFYWLESVAEPVLSGAEVTSNNNSPIVLFAVADCTGHGVPGAMVSVVCNNALNRVVREHQLTDPGAILNKTQEIVVDQFNKSEHFDALSSIRDGMDISFCSLTSQDNGATLKYAGAYNPLWIVRAKTNEIEEIRATRQSIGRVEHPKLFKTHEVNLNKGDTFYIFSDGFADQFGGVKGKKMMAKPFKNLLLSIQNKNMDEQLKTLHTHFEDWKGELEQLDDVCVMGVRI